MSPSLIVQTIDQKIRKISLLRGLILGVVTTVLSILSSYLLTKPSMSGLAFIIVPIALGRVLPLILLIFLCFNIRKSIGGLWTFKQAASGIFIMLIVAYVINVLGKDLLFDKIILPDNVQKTKLAAVERKTANMKGEGVPQDKIDISITNLKRDLMQKENNGIGSIIMGNALIIIFLFALSIILASLLRNAVLVKACSES